MTGTGAAAASLLLLGSAPASAQILLPTQMTVTIPTSGNNYSNGVLTRDGRSAAKAFVDDAYLNTITFGTGSDAVTFTASGENFVKVQSAYIVNNRDSVNAEFGDEDDGKDGNPNPFVQAGIIGEGQTLPDSVREGTNPATQDPAIAAAYNSGSLVEGVDGESTDYSINLTFQNGIYDNNSGADATPELMFFERGVNSDYSLRAIIGGTLTNPIFAPNTVTVLAKNTWPSGYYIDTIEIGGGQQLGVAGVDLSSFGISAGQAVYGVQFSSINDTGADLYGAFMSASDPATQLTATPPALLVSAVPEPGIVVSGLSMAGMTGFGLLRGRMRKRTA